MKSSLTLPRNISEILIQSELLGEERRVSSSVRPRKMGTRWLILWGGNIRIPCGTYRCVKLSHSDTTWI